MEKLFPKCILEKVNSTEFIETFGGSICDSFSFGVRTYLK
jgi:hypothetical protein